MGAEQLWWEDVWPFSPHWAVSPQDQDLQYCSVDGSHLITWQKLSCDPGIFLWHLLISEIASEWVLVQ